MAEREDGGFRAVLVANRAGESASVFVRAYGKEGDGWRLIDARMVARHGAFSWDSVGRSGSVRSFRVSARARQISFEVRITRAVGWSRPYRYRVEHGKLVGGLELCGCAPG